MEFRNQKISDILLVLGKNRGVSIIPDETVIGSASYYFSDIDFEQALTLFLNSYNYHFTKNDGIYYVSRIDLTYDSEHSLITLNAEDTEIQLIIRYLSKEIGKTILYDSLPVEKISIHCKNLHVETLLDIILAKYPDYTLEEDDNFFYIKKKLSGNGGKQEKGALFEIKEGLYSSSLQRVGYREALTDLFHLSGLEFSFLGRNDATISNFEFSGKSFNQMLRLLLDYGNGDYQIIDGIYYIIDIERRDILKRFYSTAYIQLEYTTTAEIQNLIPSSIASSQNLKIDKSNNALILSGTLEEIGPIQSFIDEIDQPHKGMEYHRFILNSIDVSLISSILPARLKFDIPVLLNESNSFIMLLPPTMIGIVEEYIGLIDVAFPGYAIELKYIKGTDLIENPPPSVNREELIETNNPNIVYFKGSESRYRNLLNDLELLDRPVPQIRYEVLVMQVQEVDKFNWDINSSNSLSSTGSSTASTAILAELGNVMNLNFDIVSQFGYQFAIDLNISMDNSESRVMADTSLNALSGENTHFQNTETYRYRETEFDPDTKEPVHSGITREITSGLIVEIEGWASGDGMITMDVKTTISKRIDSSSSNNIAIPATAERSVVTHIRTESGKPVIIGGLMQQDKITGARKTPLLGDIPFLGYLFRSEYETLQNTEMVVTIVPYLEYPEYSISDVERDIEKLYKRYMIAN